MIRTAQHADSFTSSVANLTRAAAEVGRKFRGGKLDDVAVVCGLVRCGAERPPPRVGHNFGDAAAGAVVVDAGGVVVPKPAAAV